MGWEKRKEKKKSEIRRRTGKFWMCGGESRKVMTWRREPMGREGMMRRVEVIGWDVLEA